MLDGSSNRGVDFIQLDERFRHCRLSFALRHIKSHVQSSGLPDRLPYLLDRKA